VTNPLIVIPSRIGSTRLPNKPLALIAGRPLILHVLDRAREADLAPVVVATDCREIADCVCAEGATAVMTDAVLPSGTDRIHQALGQIDPEKSYDVILNVQGDLPTIEPATLRAVLVEASMPGVDISTAVAPISSERERHASSVVKMVGSTLGEGRFKALYFTRATAPWGDGPLFHHIGLYGYRRDALERFVALPPSVLELREKLEQLRALEAGMTIHAVEVGEVPFGVDTPEDLEHAQALMGRVSA